MYVPFTLLWSFERRVLFDLYDPLLRLNGGLKLHTWLCLTIRVLVSFKLEHDELCQLQPCFAALLEY